MANSLELSSAEASLHIFLATDVHDAARLACLRRCLNGLAEQHLRCTVHIGWYASPELRSETLDALTGFSKRCDVVLCESKKRRSQFEHFAELSAQLEEAEEQAVGSVPSSAWILFHDDDDISSPTRSAYYMEAIMRCRQRVVDAGHDPADVRAPRVIQCNHVAVPVKAPAPAPASAVKARSKDDEYRTAIDIKNHTVAAVDWSLPVETRNKLR